MTQNKTITDLEQEIKEKQVIIEKQKKDLELARAQEAISAKLYAKRTWRLEHTIAKDHYHFIPVGGKHNDWAELASYLPDWGHTDICEGATLASFGNRVVLLIAADRLMELIEKIGIRINVGNLEEMMEWTNRNIQYEQDLLKDLTALKKISSGKPFRECKE